LIGKDGKIKIADFGLAARLKKRDDRTYTVCGTPQFFAPELLTKAKENGHSYEVDIWTIGVCTYTMLTGHQPFEASKLQLTYDYIR
jgi:serine/threonine protein kinase